ncbi:MAG: PhnD/SsuA/transferrin family substrate-binding protein [Bacteroidales bacterium]|nr:phosphate/phosphite/phosphonate ABC transporter substrate-binding protein [Bacteroidales bacterium]MDD2425081.1 PhnD/SsuA/transferrin family substrate-binding protein [Bacteroidales bacterium]MDD3988584.1 PhnD/SsuA/transferrin family substrate-binding protein [Bacteroidales bacterium]
MTKIKILYIIPVVAVSMLMFAACNDRSVSDNTLGETAFVPAENITAATSDQPLVVKLAVNEAYCKLTACSCIHDLASRDYAELQELLKSKYNIDLQITYFIEEYDLADTVLSGQYDGFISKPWLIYNQVYNQSEERDKNLKRIADLLDINNNQWLTGIFIVKKDSPLNSMSEINGKVFVAGQQDSYEKYHSPLTLLAKDNIVPSEIINKSSCLENLNILMDGDADVAVISDYTLTASCAVDVANPEDFSIIGETEQTPLCSVILDMSKVNESEALRLQKALLELSGDNAPAGLISKGFVHPAKWTPLRFSESSKK